MNKKDNSVRQRRNKASTRAVLTDRDPDDIEIPELPTRVENIKGEDGDYHMVEKLWQQATIDWWEDVWSSPMSEEYLDADLHGLVRLAILVDKFNEHPSSTAHAEIRLAQKDYGLTPYDRRRLEWTVETAETAKERGAQRRGSQTATQSAPADDPRLHIVGDDDDMTA